MVQSGQLFNRRCNLLSLILRPRQLQHQKRGLTDPGIVLLSTVPQTMHYHAPLATIAYYSYALSFIVSHLSVRHSSPAKSWFQGLIDHS